MISGQWPVVSDLWSVVSDLWSVVCGQWSVVCGQGAEPLIPFSILHSSFFINDRFPNPQV